MQGRRYRSTRGLWSIPYVDDTRLVFKPSSTRLDAALLGLAVVAQVVGTSAIALNVDPDLATLAGTLCVVGFASGPLAFFLYGGLALPLAAYLSHMRPVRRRLVVERIATEGGEVVLKAVVDGRRFSPTNRSQLIHATVLGQQRLLLLLGDVVLELWRSVAPGGGARLSREHDWSLERLTGDEGSARDGAREFGDGVFFPVLESLRHVLSLGTESEGKTAGPTLPPRAWLSVLVLGACVGAAVYGVDTLLRHTADVVREPALRGAIGAATGALLVLAEWLILRTWLRRTLVPLIDSFVAGVVTGKVDTRPSR